MNAMDVMSVDLLTLLWRPYFPAAATLMGVALLLGLACYVYSRSVSRHSALGVLSLSMRLLLILAIGLLLMGPSGVGPASSRSVKPRLIVMLDSSASMLTPDADGLSRYDFAVKHWLTPKRLSSWRAVNEVELMTFDDSSRVIDEASLRRSVDLVAVGRASYIAESVADVVSGADLGVTGHQAGFAVLVISDGRDTQGDPMHPVGRLARSRSIPVHTVTLGGPGMVRDLALLTEPRQPYLFVGEPGQIDVRIAQTHAGDSSTTLHVEHGDRHETYPVRFDGQNSVTIHVPIVQDSPGEYTYRVRVDPVPGEVELANNAQPVFVGVTDKRLRVLILEGRPNFDTRFLTRSLSQDRRLEVTRVTQVSPQRRETVVSHQGEGAGVLRSLEDLTHYDVIILGKGIEDVLPGDVINAIPSYVSEHGGHVVFSRGRAYDLGTAAGRRAEGALSVIEPVVFGDGVLHNRPIVFDRGVLPWLNNDNDHDHDKDIAAGLAGSETSKRETQAALTLLRLPVVIREKPTAKVLARIGSGGVTVDGPPGQPTIVSMSYGRGGVVAVLGEGLWRWGLAPRRALGDGGSFELFWSGMVRWLALGGDYQPGQPVTLRLSRRSVRLGDTVSVELNARMDFDRLGARVYVIAPDGGRSKPALELIDGGKTRRRATLTPRTKGVYRVVVETSLSSGKPIEARFNCYDVNFERLQSSADPGALRTLSELSGGQRLGPYDADQFGRVLRRQLSTMTSPSQPIYLWDRGWVMAIVLLLAGCEWIARRVGGVL